MFECVRDMIELGCAIFDHWRKPFIRLQTVTQRRGVSVQRIKLATVVIPQVGPEVEEPDISHWAGAGTPHKSPEGPTSKGLGTRARGLGSWDKCPRQDLCLRLPRRGADAQRKRGLVRGLYRQTAGSLRIGTRYSTSFLF